MTRGVPSWALRGGQHPLPASAGTCPSLPIGQSQSRAGADPPVRQTDLQTVEQVDRQTPVQTKERQVDSSPGYRQVPTPGIRLIQQWHPQGPLSSPQHTKRSGTHPPCINAPLGMHHTRYRDLNRSQAHILSVTSIESFPSVFQILVSGVSRVRPPREKTISVPLYTGTVVI